MTLILKLNKLLNKSELTELKKCYQKLEELEKELSKLKGCTKSDISLHGNHESILIFEVMMWLFI